MKVREIVKKMERIELELANPDLELKDVRKIRERATHLINELIEFDLKMAKFFENVNLEEQLKYIDDYDIVGTKAKYFGNSNGMPKFPVNDLKKNLFTVIT